MNATGRQKLEGPEPPRLGEGWLQPTAGHRGSLGCPGQRGLGACLPAGWHQAWGVQYPCPGDHSEIVARPRLGCKLAERQQGVGARQGTMPLGVSTHTSSSPVVGAGRRNPAPHRKCILLRQVPPLLPTDQTLCLLQRGSIHGEAAHEGWTWTPGGRHRELAQSVLENFMNSVSEASFTYHICSLLSAHLELCSLHHDGF